jgi:hypothetical protein
MARELRGTSLQTIQGSKLLADDALKKSHDPDRMRQRTAVPVATA